MKRRPGPRGRRHSHRPPPEKGSPNRRPTRQLNPRLQKDLKRANHLMRIGEHANAAQIFSGLGERAQDLGILRPAGMLFIQACTAHLMANQLDASLVEAKKGFMLLAGNVQSEVLNFHGQRLIQEYNDTGAITEGKELEHLLTDFAKKAGGLKESVSSQNQTFPENCPYCGASLSLDQFRNGSEKATECYYCGSIVLTQPFS